MDDEYTTPEYDGNPESCKATQRIGRGVSTTIRTRVQWATAIDGFTQNVRESPMIEIPYHHNDAQMKSGQCGLSVATMEVRSRPCTSIA